VELGYAVSSEEHSPAALVRHARLAEEAGFGFGLISDQQGFLEFAKRELLPHYA
jgi:hypothetical protein